MKISMQTIQNSSVLYESNQLLVINKPSGIISEDNSYESLNVQALCLQYLSQKENNSYLGVAHRLDRVTSGVLIFAKKRSVLKLLNLWFSERKIQKTYLAVVDQAPPKEAGLLEHFLETDDKAKKAIVLESKSAKSKTAKLTYTVIGRKEGFWLLEIKPFTGRFHQIRAQLAHVGCPIIGDVKYGGTAGSEKSIALHAWKLRLPEAINTSPTEYKAPLPSSNYWSYFSI